MNRLRRWSKEPLLHFLLLGLAGFGLDQWLASPLPAASPAASIDEAITVGPQVRARLRGDWQRRKGSTPGPADEAALVEDWIDQEVLYRQALALGLDRADPVYRKRLVDQMRLIVDGEAAPGPCTEEELAERLAEAPERYLRPAQVSFEHLFVSSALRGPQAEADAAALLVKLRAGAAPADLAADPFVRGSRFKSHERAALTRVFGPTFAGLVLGVTVGDWTGPLRSIHGLHLVRVSEVQDACPATVDEVRGRLEKDCAEIGRTAALRMALDALREEYTIVRADEGGK